MNKWIFLCSFMVAMAMSSNSLMCSMRRYKNLKTMLVLTLLISSLSLLFGCGGGGSSGTTTPATGGGTISGTAVKGPVNGAKVTAYAVTNGTMGTQLASGTGRSGTLTVTCEYLDDYGVKHPLSNAYVYLHDESKKPHVDRSFNRPSYIVGPSDAGGRISATVPEGRYYIRITKRNPKNENRLGPPEPMDYTWSQKNAIAIRADATTDLGIKYAGHFTAPITLTGTVTRTTGDSAEGLSVSVLTEPCHVDNGDVNQCGPDKILARKRTDANGRYTLALRDPGTYYIYVGTCRSGQGGSLPGAGLCAVDYGGMVTVSLGETKTQNIVTYH